MNTNWIMAPESKVEYVDNTGAFVKEDNFPINLDKVYVFHLPYCPNKINFDCGNWQVTKMHFSTKQLRDDFYYKLLVKVGVRSV